MRGLRPGETPSARRLFSGLLLLPIDEEAAWRAGDWRRSQAQRGRTLSQQDCLIAATALLADGTLATGNPKDFPTNGLQVQHWPVGQ